MALPKVLFEPRSDFPKNIFGVGPTNLYEAFVNLVCALSPENLSCDGELSRTQVNKKLAGIRREWKALEKMAGVKVDPDAIETEMLDRYRAERTGR
jgi:hypothetical protein